MKRADKIYFLVLLCVPLALLFRFGFLMLAISNDWTYHVATLDCGENRKIEIRATYWWELYQRLHYQVYEGRRGLFDEPVWFGDVMSEIDLDTLSFHLVQSADQSVIGITEGSHPTEVILMQDFRNWKSWNYYASLSIDESMVADEATAEAMLALLRGRHPALVLADCDGTVGPRP